ncbi:NUDIX hydrolase [uncultured Pelagimonas sp.]|uniref:NUDIX domain-containing protein n=1 Tax=uncultured Pelagimonas sp. TaxID=1618102 RepID=UPI00260334CB|nr:NUDIX hydrolase [uncultured Pelagimonas sp.]
MNNRPIRLAVRGIILHENRVLLVNAWPPSKSRQQSDLWCAPGGGVEKGQSLPDNLAREIMEECGFHVDVGAPCLINEFHNPDDGFHQVEVFFRCQMSGDMPSVWQDPEQVVTKRRFFGRDEVQALRLKPESLRRIPWTDEIAYDALERLVK